MQIEAQEWKTLYERYPAGELAMIIFRNIGRWAHWRHETRHPAASGVWLDATRPDPIAFLCQARPERKKRWRLKSKSGWKPGGSPKASGSHEMVLR